LEGTFGIALAGERHRIAAKNLLAEEAEKLRVEPGSAALAVAGTGYAAGGDRPIWYQILLYRGDRYSLENFIRQESRAGSTEWKLIHAG
jgi:DNA-binding GntR family transcriptional regulator